MKLTENAVVSLQMYLYMEIFGLFIAVIWTFKTVKNLPELLRTDL